VHSDPCFPSGTSIQYSRDAAGRISGVTALPPGTSGAGAGNVVTAISYLPFGPIANYTLGNGQTITRTYDANYALTDVVSPALNLHFARDATGNITALGNAPGANPATETYSYDPLYRLTGLTDGNGNVEEAYTYSKTGDRLSKTASGLATGVYTYQAGTHHLASIGNASRAYDANGNTTGSIIGGSTFGYGYDGRNRMTVVQRDGSTVGTYTYNSLGQRTAKVATFPAAGSQRFSYDESSQLLGEYGSALRDYIWLGALPVAVVDTAGGVSVVSYVHADGLSTPRVVTDATGASIWQLAYQGNAFGEQQPTTSGGFAYNLRFPGQYYDVESGLNYNANRDYEAATGRYIQSDPIGLDGGLSTYEYVAASPLDSIDPSGQVKIPGIPGASGDNSVHANPGPDASPYRAEHDPPHVHLGGNDGPRVSTETFEPLSAEDARRMTRGQKKFCDGLSKESKDLIKLRQGQVFKFGRVIEALESLSPMALDSFTATCHNDPFFCIDTFPQDVQGFARDHNIPVNNNEQN
jgi:RHS repeat-associated protein